MQDLEILWDELQLNNDDLDDKVNDCILNTLKRMVFLSGIDLFSLITMHSVE